MRLVLAFGLAAAAAAATSSERLVDAPESGPEVTVVQPNKSYAVKLECRGCPFVKTVSHANVTWEHPPRDNSLV